MPDFDPDAYLASKKSFDPDAYLASKGGTQSDTADPYASLKPTIGNPAEALSRIQSGDFSMLPPALVADVEKRFPVQDLSKEALPKNQFGQTIYPDPDTIYWNDRQKSLRNQELAKWALRQERPELAKQIENMSGPEAALVAAGKTTNDIVQGVGRLTGNVSQEQAQTPDEYGALKTFHPTGTTTGELGAQGAIFAIPGSQTAKIASVAPRMLTTGLAEGTLTGLQSAGQGGSPEDIAKAATVGGIAGPMVGEVMGPGFRNQPKTPKTSPISQEKISENIDIGKPPLPTEIPKGSIENIDIGKTPLPTEIPKGSIENIDIGKTPIPALESAPTLSRTERLVNALKAGDREAAGYKLRNGKPVEDPLQMKALDEGFDPSTVATVHKMNGAEKVNSRKMLSRIERYLENPTEGARNHPASVIGDSVMERFNAVLKENKRARLQQKQAIKGFENKKIDSSAVIDDFENAINRLGYARELTKDGVKLRPMDPALRGNSGNKVLQVINDYFQGRTTGRKLQELKDYLDDKINWGQDALNQNKMDKKIIDVMKDVRGSINDSLRNTSKQYAKANDTLSETITTLGDFADTMGSRFDPKAENISDLVGSKTRSMLSNNGVGPDMMEAISRLDAAAAKYGSKFNDDPLKLARLYSDLEGRFGSFKPQSFQGNIEKANTVSIGKNLAMGNYGTAALETAKAGVNAVGQKSAARRLALKKIVDDRKAIAALRKVLEQ